MSQNNAIKINKYFKFAIKHIFIKLIKHIMIFFQNIKIYKRINCCIKWVFPPQDGSNANATTQRPNKDNNDTEKGVSLSSDGNRHLTPTNLM